MDPATLSDATLSDAAARLAALLTGAGGTLADVGATAADRPGGSQLDFEGDLRTRPLVRLAPPADAWAIDGGQALAADARCLQLLVTRASRVRFRGGACVLEEEGELRAHLLGAGQNRIAAASLGLGPGLAADTSVDANLLRDRWEWEAAARAVAEAEAGAL